jgi:ribonuclease P protein component
MRLHILANSLAVNRAVFVPVRSYRSSVARNRARRLIRECWRLGKARLIAGHDVAIVLYPGTDSLEERGAQLDRLLGQAGLLAVRR